MTSKNYAAKRLSAILAAAPALPLISLAFTFLTEGSPEESTIRTVGLTTLGLLIGYLLLLTMVWWEDLEMFVECQAIKYRQRRRMRKQRKAL